jgi:hypothetical protein
MLAMSRPDPITEELFRNAIAALGDEMVLTIYRTAYSGVLKNIMDYSAALCDAQGRLAAQGLALPGHLCSIPVALQAVLRHFGDDIAEGDILINNDPYDGGMHLPDIFIFKPLFAPGEQHGRPIAYAATICHHTDVGGRVPGSNASDSTEIYAEGLRIPPLKLYERGRPNTTLFRMIDRNVRVPGRVLGDIRSQLAACEIAARGMADLVERYGADGVTSLMNATMDYSERLTRHCLSELPDGEATFTDWIDDDQIDIGKPIPLVCTVRKRGDAMDRQRAAGEGRDQQHLELHRSDELHRGEVGAVHQHAEQRRRVPPHQGDRATRHDHARQAAGRLRGARTDRLPWRRLLFRRPGATVSGSRLRCVRWRQHGRHDRRLRYDAAAIHLRRFSVRLLGRAAVGRWVGRQHVDVRQHGQFFCGSDRGGKSARSAGLRICPRHRRRGKVPRRHVAAQDMADAG